MRFDLRCVALAGVALAYFAVSPARAEDGDADAATAQVVTVSLAKRAPKVGERTVEVVVTEAGPNGRREVPFAVQIGTSARMAVADVDAALREIKPHYGAQEEQYRAWVRGEIVDERVRTRPGTLKLGGLESRLDLTCPRSVDAGQPIELTIKSVGNFVSTWNVYVVYPTPSDDWGDAFTDKMQMKPDTGAYEIQAIEAGGALQGSEAKVLQFGTYPADRESSLGVRIENPQHIEDGVTFWVKIR